MLTESKKGFSIDNLEEDWSLQRVADELGCSKTVYC